MVGPKPDAWMPLFIGDYLKDTGRLSTEQHGAYFLLIMDYWTNGPPADDDDELAAITRLELRIWRRHRPKIERFFQIGGGQWRHKRIDQELSGAQDRSDKAAEKASAAARVRWERERAKRLAGSASGNAPSIAPGNAPEMLEECPSQSPSSPPSGGRVEGADAPSAESRGRGMSSPDRELVERLWSAQPICGGKRKATRPEVAKALGAALRRGGDAAEIELAFRAYYALPDCQRDGGQYAKGAAVLLNDDKWRDFLTPAEAAPAGADWPDTRWAAAVRIWRAEGLWDDALGPPPGQPGCRVPTGVLIAPVTKEAAA